MLFWQVSLLLDIPFQSFLEQDQALSKQAKFLIWNAKGVFLNECFIFVQLTIKVPSTETKLTQPGQFYVRNPILEPRRLPQIKREPTIGVHRIQQIMVLEKKTGEGSSGQKELKDFDSSGSSGIQTRHQDHSISQNYSEIQNQNMNYSRSKNGYQNYKRIQPDLLANCSAMPEVYDTSN